MQCKIVIKKPGAHTCNKTFSPVGLRLVLTSCGYWLTFLNLTTPAFKCTEHLEVVENFETEKQDLWETTTLESLFLN